MGKIRKREKKKVFWGLGGGGGDVKGGKGGGGVTEESHRRAINEKKKKIGGEKEMSTRGRQRGESEKEHNVLSLEKSYVSWGVKMNQSKYYGEERRVKGCKKRTQEGDNEKTWSSER